MKRSDIIQGILQNIGSMSRLGAGGMAQGAWPKGMPTRAQLGVMFVLSHRGAQGIKELASQFGISSSAITQLVNGMVSEGLLVRAAGTKDRRSVRIDMTVKGKKKLSEAKAARMKMMATLFEPLSDRELGQFLELQQKMNDHFQRTWRKK